MSAFVIMILVSMVLAGAFLGAFIWAVLSGQFKDNTTPAMRILHEQPARGTGRTIKKNEENT